MVPLLGLYKRILNSSGRLIFLIHNKHKMAPRLHSLEGELIHWVDKAKNVWLTVGQVLQYFSHKYKVPTTWVAQENPEVPLPPNSLYSHQI